MQWENAKDRSPGTVLADGKGRWAPRLVLYSPAVLSSYCGGISGLHQNCAGITDCVGLLTWEMKRVVSDVIELLLVLVSLCSISSPSDVAGLRDCDMIGWFVL